MYIKLNGVTYSYMIRGRGPAIVLLHGFTGCKENWEFLSKKLTDRFTVITIDLIGHGKTDSPLDTERYLMQHVCRDLNTLLDKLEINAAHFLGYSMGGRVALAFSVMYPSRVISLILESSSPGLQSEEAKQARITADDKLASDILSHGIVDFVANWQEISLFRSQKKLPQVIQDRIRIQRLSNGTLGLSNSLRGMGTGRQDSYWGKLSSIKVPVLLLCGKLDEKFCAIADEVEKYLLYSTNYKFSNVGHAIHVEQPDLFGKIVNEFLSKHNQLGGLI